MRRRLPGAGAAGLAVVALALAGVGVAPAARAATAARAIPAARAATADECTGLRVCVSVKGPWVKLSAPAPGAASALAVEWELKCPSPRYVVGGTDARVSSPAVNVTIEGGTGSPVGPGTTTKNAVVFRGVYGGSDPVATSFRPAIGCVPTQGGGGGRSQVRWQADFSPLTALDARTKELQVPSYRSVDLSLSCQSGGRLLRSSAAVGLRTPQPPAPALLATVGLKARVTGATVAAHASASAKLPLTVEATLQVRVVCTQGFQ